MLDDISTNVAEVIPYRNFKEKLKIVKQELKKNRYVEVWNGYIYSSKKWWKYE